MLYDGGVQILSPRSLDIPISRESNAYGLELQTPDSTV